MAKRSNKGTCPRKCPSKKSGRSTGTYRSRTECSRRAQGEKPTTRFALPPFDAKGPEPKTTPESWRSRIRRILSSKPDTQETQKLRPDAAGNLSCERKARTSETSVRRLEKKPGFRKASGG